MQKVRKPECNGSGYKYNQTEKRSSRLYVVVLYRMVVDSGEMDIFNRSCFISQNIYTKKAEGGQQDKAYCSLSKLRSFVGVIEFYKNINNYERSRQQ